jgi:hypothetical protein
LGCFCFNPLAAQRTAFHRFAETGTATIDTLWDGFGNANNEYSIVTDTYNFTGMATTPEPPGWSLFSGAFLAALIAKRKKLITLFSDIGA